MDILVEHTFFFLVIGLLFAATLFFASFKLTGDLTHPFVVNSPLIGMYSCFIGVLLYVKTDTVVGLALGLLVFIISLYFGFFSIIRFNVHDSTRMPHDSSTGLSLVFIALYIFILFANLKLNVFDSGISLSDIGNQRYEARTGNRFVFLAAIAWRTIVFYFIAVTWGKPIVWIGIVALLVSWINSFLLGSKAAILGVGIDILLLVFYVRLLSPNLWLKNRTSFNYRRTGGGHIGKILVCLFLIIIFSPFAIVFSKSEMTYLNAAEAIGMRVLSGFDNLFFAVDASLQPNESPTWFGTWWLSSPLKVLNLFNSPYNGANHYLMSKFLGAAAADAGGMFPNNNLILEVFITNPLWAAFGWLIFLGICYGLITALSLKKARQSAFWGILCIHLTYNPFGMLIDGQGFATGFITLIPILALGFFDRKSGNVNYTYKN